MEVRNVVVKVRNVLPREDGTLCTICLTPLAVDDVVANLECNHLYHHDCILPWLRRKSTCPLCAQHIDLETTSQSPTSGSPTSPPSRNDEVPLEDDSGLLSPSRPIPPVQHPLEQDDSGLLSPSRPPVLTPVLASDQSPETHPLTRTTTLPETHPLTTPRDLSQTAETHPLTPDLSSQSAGGPESHPLTSTTSLPADTNVTTTTTTTTGVPRDPLTMAAV